MASLAGGGAVRCGWRAEAVEGATLGGTRAEAGGRLIFAVSKEVSSTRIDVYSAGKRVKYGQCWVFAVTLKHAGREGAGITATATLKSEAGDKVFSKTDTVGFELTDTDKNGVVEGPPIVAMYGDIILGGMKLDDVNN